MFPLFLKMVVDIVASKLGTIFRRHIHFESFPENDSNVNDIPVGAQSPDMENFRPISITHILSKVYEKLISHKLSSFFEKCTFLSAA